MKQKILLKSFLMLTLMVAFGAQVYASEVTGTLSSSAQGEGDGSGSEVTGTLDNGTIAGTVGGGGSSSGSSSGSSRRTTGQVLGASDDNTGEVLGATYTPGFPTTGLGPKTTTNSTNLVALALSVTALMMYAYHKTRINA